MMKYTKIVVTVGPACQSAKVLSRLVREGADVFRLNASHTTPAGLRQWIRHIKKVVKSAKKKAAILVDLQGPRVRTGSLIDCQSVLLTQGQMITVRIGKQKGNKDFIFTSCKEFCDMVSVGDPILIDNGLIELKVLKKKKQAVECSVVVGGFLGENKGINLPKAPITLPALTAKDKQDLTVAAEMDATYVALSFVRSASDVIAVKKFLKKLKKKIPVIAKIEKPLAVENLDEILKVSNAIMVARGDLGIEFGVEKIPMLQKDIIERANEVGVPVITATQMLESMMITPRPSRAEVSDIANATLDGTDAVMLSGETAVGKYPVEAVRMMSKIIHEAETHIGDVRPVLGSLSDRFSPASYAITHAAYHAARELGAKAIVTFTVSGKTSILISKMKPRIPVIALCPSESTSLQLSLLRGVIPLVSSFSNSTDQMVRKADKLILSKKLLKRGDYVILVSGKSALPAALHMTKVHQIGQQLKQVRMNR